MHKLFRTYMNTIVIFGSVIFLLFAFQMTQIKLEFDMMKILVIGIMTITSAVIVLDYSEDKTISLYSTFIILALYFLQVQWVILIIFISDLLYKLELKYILKEHDKIFDVKLTFNIMSKVIIIGCIYLMGIFVANDLVFIILSCITYNILNALSVVWVIKLYNNDPKLKVLSGEMIIKEMFYLLMTTTLLIFAYKSYSYLGLIYVFIFLMSFVGYILKPVTHKEMLNQIYHDTLTGVRSRGLLDKYLFDKIYGRIPFTLLFIDFDDFKSINDLYGHDVGDSVLKEFSLKMKNEFELYDNLYRFGGDEFCVIVDESDDINKVLENLESILKTNVYKDKKVKFDYHVSFGKFRYNGENTMNVSDVIASVSYNMKAVKQKNKAL